MRHPKWVPLIKEAMWQSAMRSVNAADSADTGYMHYLDFSGLKDFDASLSAIVGCRQRWRESNMWLKYLKRCARIMSRLTEGEYTVASAYDNREIVITDPAGKNHVFSGGPFPGE